MWGGRIPSAGVSSFRLLAHPAVPSWFASVSQDPGSSWGPKCLQICLVPLRQHHGSWKDPGQGCTKKKNLGENGTAAIFCPQLASALLAVGFLERPLNRQTLPHPNTESGFWIVGKNKATILSLAP